jgi:hypothetical protein
MPHIAAGVRDERKKRPPRPKSKPDPGQEIDDQNPGDEAGQVGDSSPAGRQVQGWRDRRRVRRVNDPNEKNKPEQMDHPTSLSDGVGAGTRFALGAPTTSQTQRLSSQSTTKAFIEPRCMSRAI